MRIYVYLAVRRAVGNRLHCYLSRSDIWTWKGIRRSFSDEIIRR
nr:MAG TPA: hypothetical protein [Caudoviricetes sp.]